MLSAFAVIAVVFGTPAVASSAVAAPATTARAHAPRAVPTQHELSGVSCLSPRDCIAVGLNLNVPGHMGAPLAETWNGGKAWKAATLSLPKGSVAGQLLAVSCKPKAFCVAVGVSFSPADTGLPLAETWNGRTWTPKTLPAVKGTIRAEMLGVSCATTKSCVAVGEAFTKTTVVAIAETWNGKTWTPALVSPVKGASASSLTSVSCISAVHCVAAGLYSAQGVTFPLIETWNGRAWTRTKAPSPAGSASAILYAVSCVSVKACVAVGGFRFNRPGSTGFTEVWNGKSWAEAGVPWPKALTDTTLFGVSCGSATTCAAAGESAVLRAVAASWNGKHWTVTAVSAPPAVDISLFEAVSCPASASCVAVGHQGADSVDGTGLSGIWNGKSWHLLLAV
jgi:hypothetical protein